MNQMNSAIAAPDKYHGIVSGIKDQLGQGVSFNNPRLTALAEKYFGGGRGAGSYTPKDAYDAMETAANLLLLKSAGQEILQFPVTEALVALRRLTGQLATQNDRTDEMNEFQQFSTPPPFAFLVARLLAPQPGEIVIEPSAGTGNLAVWAKLMGAEVHVNELAVRRREMLRLLGFEPTGHDAELLDDLLDPAIKPSGILMNPPFSSTAGRVSGNNSIYGAKHVESALRRLEPGGRLVAVLSCGMAFGSTKFRDWWQRIARLYNVRANLTVSGKEYAKFGTTVDTQIIIIDKDGATPGTNWADQIKNINWSKAETLEAVWEALKHLAVREMRQTKEKVETEAAQVFAPYVVQRLTGGAAHPAEIVESASMAAVMPPPATYRPHLPLGVITSGKLSIIQLESVIYAGQRHGQRLPNGARGGVFIGHGTGVGKGRCLAAIIADNWNQGRRRALWLSVNNDLMPSTKRDLCDISHGHIPLARINSYQADGEITLPEGVIFASYSSLISASKNGATRLDQIQRWLGSEGVVIMDEASKAKNAIGSGRGSDGTQTGQAVIDLQDAERNPDYRFVYASATGATDVRNMAYMARFGLWGPGTSFPGGFNEFMNEIEGGGVGAMEMVSRDLKALGLYLSGSISFGVDPASGKAVEYRERVHWLTPEQQEMYDLAAKAWQVVLTNVDEAIKITGGGKRQRANAMTKFWGDHQRFFCQVITAFKVPAAIQEVEQALAEGKSVVLSLVSTGEARTREQVAKAAASGGALEDLDFTPREVIAQMVERGFPTTVYQDVTDPATGRTYQEVVKDGDGNPVQSREALRLKERLMDGLSALRLPENPLDQIVNHFGESVVAELTGRSRRLIRDKQTGQVTYKKRAPQGVAMDSVNIHEMEQFQAGRKRVAIISDAASMGISLHASNQCENKQRRVHITLQLGWSADKQLQVFGRTHRSDQVMPPEYVLLSTNLGGERRFSSTIARRLASLGALTKGDRSAADSGDLAKYNFETEEGRAALLMMFARIKRGDDVAGLADPKQTLRDMGLLQSDSDGVEGVRKEDERNIPRFLNRVLALDVGRQNALFEYFSGIFDLTVLNAKESGTFDEGVTDIHALAIRFGQPPRVIATDETTGAKTTHYLLEIDREVKTCSLESAEIERHRAMAIGLKTGYYLHNKDGYVVLAVASRQHTDADTGQIYQNFAIWKPTGARVQYRDERDLSSKFRTVPVEQASLRWQFEFSALPTVETTKAHIIGGAILPLWRRLRGENESRLKVVRVTTDSGQRIVGAQISAMMVGPVLRAIGVSRNLKTPEEILAALLEGDRVPLVAGMYLGRSNVRGEVRIELGGNVRYGDFDLLRRMGMLSEHINYRRMFFVPTDPSKGVPVLTALLKQYPPLKTTEEVDRELAGEVEPIGGELLAETFEPVDVRQLIVPVEMQPEPGQAGPGAEDEPKAEPIAEKPEMVAPPHRKPLPVTRPAVAAPMTAGEPVAVIQYDGNQGLLF